VRGQSRGMVETKTMNVKKKVAFGLTLPNRGVITGATTVAEMLEMAEWADSAGWDSVWVGDSIFAKPRLDAIALLGALAARTKRVRLGPACFASTPLRDPLILAYQWACLDFMSGGRTIFVACKGQPEVGGGNFEQEFATFRVDPKSRVRRMEEAVEIMRLTSLHESASYDGKYARFRDLTILPRPVQQPLPIWVTANPRLPHDFPSAFRRVAKLGVPSSSMMLGQLVQMATYHGKSSLEASSIKERLDPYRAARMKLPRCAIASRPSGRIAANRCHT
jgi:hypothetical protein